MVAGYMPRAETPPEDNGPTVRRCVRGERCANSADGKGAKVNRYHKPCSDGHKSALLCYACQDVRLKQGVSLTEFVMVRKHRSLPHTGRTDARLLPNLKAYIGGVNRRAISEDTGISIRHIGRLVQMQVKASPECRRRIAAYLGVTAEDLTGERE